MEVETHAYSFFSIIFWIYIALCDRFYFVYSLGACVRVHGVLMRILLMHRFFLVVQIEFLLPCSLLQTLSECNQTNISSNGRKLFPNMLLTKRNCFFERAFELRDASHHLRTLSRRSCCTMIFIGYLFFSTSC